MGSFIIDFDYHDDYNVEMNLYTDFSNDPHIVEILHKHNNKVFCTKKCKTQSDAIRYLYEARDFQNNKNIFSFRITGPNLFLYEG